MRHCFELYSLDDIYESEYMCVYKHWTCMMTCTFADLDDLYDFPEAI